jgi:hypothetical protein
LKSLGALMLGAFVMPSIASAKKRKKKAKPAAVVDDAPPAGDALKDAQLTKRDNVWWLRNKSESQRIVVVIRVRQPGASAAVTEAYSLEPGQEAAVVAVQSDAKAKPTIVGAVYN